MKHKVILTRTFVTEIEIEAEDRIEAEEKFKELGDSVYQQELEQCNVVSQTIIIDSEDDGVRICSVTGEEMTEGWVAGDGEEYFKYEKDALAWCKNNGYETLQEGFDDEAIYWTEWETPSFITNI